MEDALSYGVNENILTRGLGTADPIDVDSGDVDLHPGDLFLFCTDGLTGMVADEGLKRTLLRAGDELETTAVELVDLACEGGGLDNITVALMRVS